MNDDEATKLVHAFIDVLHTEYGVDKNQTRAMVDNLGALQVRMEEYRHLWGIFKETLVRLAAAALVAGIGWAIVHFVRELARAI